MVYLIGGLTVIAIIIVAVPLLIMRGTAILSDIIGKSEVEDDET